MFDHDDVQSRLFGQCLTAIPMGAVSGGTDQRNFSCTTFGHLLIKTTSGHVDNVLCHDAIGRVFASGDGDQPRDRLTDGVLTREQTRRFALALEQRSQAGINAFDVFVPKRLGEDGVDMVEEVVDVSLAGGGMSEIEIPFRVGRADDPVAFPRNDEEDALLGS